jgi:hypothetical protein
MSTWASTPDPDVYNQVIVSRAQKGFIGAAVDHRARKDEFTQNNMVPFGRRVYQNVTDNAYSRHLETYSGDNEPGHGKREVKAMFDVSRQDGQLPNSLDFQQSRINVPRFYNNTFPAQQVIVGPGLNAGYTAAPSGGYQQASAREYQLPRTIDESRVVGKRQVTHCVPIQAGQGAQQVGRSAVPNKRQAPLIASQAPLPNTGQYQPQNMPQAFFPIETFRGTQESDYTPGADPGGSSKGPVATCPTTLRRDVEEGVRVANPALTSAGNPSFDYGRSGICLPPTSREAFTVGPGPQPGLTTSVKAMVSAFTDALRPSRKEMQVLGAREFGTMQAVLPSKSTVYDPNDVARTTLKETIIHDVHSGYLMGDRTDTAEYDPSFTAKPTTRETLDQPETTANFAGPKKSPAYDPSQPARTTTRQTLDAKDGWLGAVAALLPGMSSRDGAWESNTTRSVGEWFRPGVALWNLMVGGYRSSTVTAPATTRSLLSTQDFLGAATSIFKKGTRAGCAARPESMKQQTLARRAPTGSSVKSAMGKDAVRLTREPEKGICPSQPTGSFLDRVHQKTLGAGDRLAPAFDPNSVDLPTHRLDPALLDGLRTNPYALCSALPMTR